MVVTVIDIVDVAVIDYWRWVAAILAAESGGLAAA